LAVVGVSRMHRQLGWWQGEDQPVVPGVDEWTLKGRRVRRLDLPRDQLEKLRAARMHMAARPRTNSTNNVGNWWMV
jgi:hypothetical protein